MNEVLRYLQDAAEQALGRTIGMTEVATLHKYLNLLIKWQKTQRLIGSAEPRWIVDHVIVDSLLFSRALPSPISTLCDVGSGAGIPGIPLKVVMPDVDVTLIEARQRRGSFLAAAIRELPLQRCQVVNRRLEDVIGELAGRFDAVVMRCAGDPAQLISQIEQLLAPGGVAVASGPPTAKGVEVGRWVEVETPRGSRRFWRYDGP